MFGRFMGLGLLGEYEIVGGEAVLGAVSFLCSRKVGRSQIYRESRK